jgi:hypothetical protein
MLWKSSLAQSHQFVCKVRSLEETMHATHAGISQIDDGQCARDETNPDV